MLGHIKFACDSVNSNEDNIYVRIPVKIKFFSLFHNQENKIANGNRSREVTENGTGRE